MFVALVSSVTAGPVAAAEGRPDVLVADFEGRDYGNWKAQGEAFGTGPAQGTLSNQMQVSGFQGKGLVNSYHKGDGTTGRLVSPPLVIQRKHINFLIGGGGFEGRTCINLLLDGKVVRTTTGPNTQPGGSERLDWHSWDVTDLAGKSVIIEVVDQATGGWGHINIDQIIQSDTPKVTRDAQRQITAEQRYLNLPVKSGAPKRRMAVIADGQTVREFEIELADAEPDFWAFLDLAPFAGRQLTLQVDRLPEGSKGLAAATQDATIRGSENLYRETLRPQFHFSSRRGWLNDPNGLVYYKGEYHLYYQHNPYGWDWGNMHWGHAVSKDLVHWQELPIAIYPKRFGDWAFSGSAVVDRDNTAGFKKGEEDVIVAAWTSTGRGECISYSNDRGRTFTEYQGNPVVKHKGRDPKIIWYAPGRHWVMAVYDEQEQSGKGIAFYTSTDLKAWERRSYLDGYFECPEIFELPLDGDPNRSKWVVYAADGAYSVGSFNGKAFTRESGKHPGHYGNCFYASQTYSDIPPDDGRRIRIGWGQVKTPAMPFNQMMTIPTELELRTTEDGPRLFALPVREFEKLRGRRHEIGPRELSADANPLSGVSGELFDIRAELEPRQAAELGFTIRGVPVVYKVKERQLHCHGRTAPLKLSDGRVQFRILVDRTSIEIFANDGLVYMPIGIIPRQDDRSLSAWSKGGARIYSLDVFELRSTWH
jgi:fructan beta-fructosidase